MDTFRDDVSKQVLHLINKISFQISNDHDISISKINESIEKIIGPLDGTVKVCKGVCKSTNTPCTIQLGPGQGDYCKRHVYQCGSEFNSETKICKGFVKSTNTPCTVELCVDGGDYCKRHKFQDTITGDFRCDTVPMQCAAITNKSTRCRHSAIKNGYCKKHVFISNSSETFDITRRKCLYTTVNNDGDLERCRMIVNDKYYTCNQHREFETSLMNDYNITIDAIQFHKDFLENKIKNESALQIYGLVDD